MKDSQVIELCGFGKEIVSRGLSPEVLKLGVVDEGISGGRCIGTVDHTEESAVEKQGGSVGVEKDGRVPEVVMIDDQFAGGRLDPKPSPSGATKGRDRR